MKICCVTGHRPYKFPFDYMDRDGEAYRKYADRLYLAVKELALNGYGLFLSGMADGARTAISFSRLCGQKESLASAERQ